MSESNTDTKEVVAEEAVAKKPKATKKATTKAKATTSKTKKETVAKKPKAVKKEKTETVVATEVKSEEPLVVEVAAEVKEETKTSSNKYYAIAAAILLAMVLTVVTFFQNEYETVVASIDSYITELTENSDVAVNEETLSSDTVATVNDFNMPMSDQIAQPAYGYQSYGMTPAQNTSFNTMRENHRAAYENSVSKHKARIAEMRELRTASFKRMDEDRIARVKRMEEMNAKTQQIQLEMQQKMQAAYNEFHAI